MAGRQKSRMERWIAGRIEDLTWLSLLLEARRIQLASRKGQASIAGFLLCIKKTYFNLKDNGVAAYFYYCKVRYSIMARIKLCENPPRRGK